MRRQRRALLLAAAPLALAGCGFALRKAPSFSFHSIDLALPATSGLGLELRRQLQGTGQVQVITDAAQKAKADVVLESKGEQRERAVVSLTATGEVREFQLRIRFAFRVVTPAGRELLPTSEILREIDQSYSESAALSKEQEALMLYQNMQSDIVQQVMRRLATVKLN
ncbi:LPS assembly lipoprotein LptE [Ottowia sp.]|uniref:LPS-assembly lipoprotein LptE n=1 Tax=Ottowia sp. TaxID=1898956 RepID=UPI0025ECC5EF|nr:LPS assembly lipoprotein LptE [Ottowia sp.]